MVLGFAIQHPVHNLLCQCCVRFINNGIEFIGSSPHIDDFYRFSTAAVLVAVSPMD